jgi:hypothetical protein
MSRAILVLPFWALGGVRNVGVCVRACSRLHGAVMWAVQSEVLCKLHVAESNGSAVKYLSAELILKRLGFS